MTLNDVRAGDRVTILVPYGIGRNGRDWKAPLCAVRPPARGSSIWAAATGLLASPRKRIL
jgi:hypothetical protein